MGVGFNGLIAVCEHGWLVTNGYNFDLTVPDQPLEKHSDNCLLLFTMLIEIPTHNEQKLLKWNNIKEIFLVPICCPFNSDP